MLWRVPMEDRRFARKVRRLARASKWANKITDVQYDKIVTATRDPATLSQMRSEVERKFAVPWKQGQKYNGFEWASIWGWLVENWPDILAFILKILPLFLMEKPDATDKTSR